MLNKISKLIGERIKPARQTATYVRHSQNFCVAADIDPLQTKLDINEWEMAVGENSHNCTDAMMLMKRDILLEIDGN